MISLQISSFGVRRQHLLRFCKRTVVLVRNLTPYVYWHDVYEQYLVTIPSHLLDVCNIAVCALAVISAIEYPLDKELHAYK
ncbi:hypothetical protein D3C75_998530 [compost metagenome]